MTKATPIEIIRGILGSWRLPIRDDESVTTTFFPNGHFFRTVAAYGAMKQAIQV
jgi:hypothetical protein